MELQVEEKWTKTDTIDVAIDDEVEFDVLLGHIEDEVNRQMITTSEDVLWYLQEEGIKVNSYREGAEECEVSID